MAGLITQLIDRARAITAAGLLLAFLPGAAAAETVSDLYQGSTLVTGQIEETRVPGFGRCLRDVLVKVSGDLRLLHDPRLDALEKEAARFVRGFRYRDLLEGIPIHDEQGSRDRPYELTVDFDAVQIDETLRALGRQPWTAERRRLALFLRIDKGAGSFLLTSDGERGIDEREALAAASKRRGVPIALPSRAIVRDEGLTIETLSSDDAPKLAAASRRIGADLVLAGRMRWDEAMPGWIADWRLASAGTTHQWRTRLPTFDETFRSALGGAAQILAGYGPPQ